MICSRGEFDRASSDGEREVPGSVLPDSGLRSAHSCAHSESGETVPGSVLSHTGSKQKGASRSVTLR